MKSQKSTFPIEGALVFQGQEKNNLLISEMNEQSNFCEWYLHFYSSHKSYLWEVNHFTFKCTFCREHSHSLLCSFCTILLHSSLVRVLLILQQENYLLYLQSKCLLISSDIFALADQDGSTVLKDLWLSIYSWSIFHYFPDRDSFVQCILLGIFHSVTCLSI